jgi:hypothetical protein
MTDLVTRLLSGLDGAGATKRDWVLAIGANLFDRLHQTGVLEGPSGLAEARCFDCDDAGHIAPVVRIEATYRLLCMQAGLVKLRDAEVELYRVSRRHLLIEISRAFEVSAPDKELRMLTGGLYFLGRARLGKTPFSLIFADRIRTREVFEDLMRRNREGFGQEKGIIIVVDEIWGVGVDGGTHSIAPAASVIDFVDTGLRPRWGEIRRHLGLPGRPRGDSSKLDEATEGFRKLFEKHKPFPAGQDGFSLFKRENPELAHIGDSTLYRAKAIAKAS